MFQKRIEALIELIRVNGVDNPLKNAGDKMDKLWRDAIAAGLPAGPIWPFTTTTGEYRHLRIANGFKAYRPGQAARDGLPPALHFVYGGMRGDEPWAASDEDWHETMAQLAAILGLWIAAEDPRPEENSMPNSPPTDADVEAALLRLNLDGNEYKPYSYREFKDRGITAESLTQAKSKGRVEAATQKGPHGENLYLVRSVVQAFFHKFKPQT